MGDWGAALAAEESVDDLARGALVAGVGLDWAVDLELVLLDNGDESYESLAQLSRNVQSYLVRAAGQRNLQ